MYYFYVDKVRKAKKGIPEERFSKKRLYRYHREAEEEAGKSGKKEVLVVDTTKLASPVADAGKLPKEAILNVGPFLPTREVVAGGGIITRMGKKKMKVLLIFRKEKWDIAKGKLDPGETIKQCAHREVCEELGISNVRVLDFLDTTVHGYPEDDTFVVKTTYWYHMQTPERKFTPQLDEKITDVKWFSFEKALSVLGHVTLVHLLQRVEDQLRAHTPPRGAG
ncbi:MAG: hypothetical protein COV99_10960 [Bacteroidetes bacterium CG12_big_fil_rev_8_21_14_0_65_60_17]|nr:MAG: hypothetical protein COV99_10960 [Bacteroidetes bacterium CG12_big_fil_rev_8_21_14_0_65_60_17]